MFRLLPLALTYTETITPSISALLHHPPSPCWTPLWSRRCDPKIIKILQKKIHKNMHNIFTDSLILDHTCAHTHIYTLTHIPGVLWNGNARSHESLLHLQQTAAAKKRRPLCRCVRRDGVRASYPYPWVTATWQRQNWNESTTKCRCNFCSRGLAAGSWQEKRLGSADPGAWK